MNSESPIPAGRAVFEWQKHIGLFVGVGASTLICLKLLAVAGWNSTTAFGILAANGTVNVLTGTLLAILPLLYWAFVVTLLPRVERYLRARTSVERTAARLLESWALTLLVLIAPLMLLLPLAAYAIYAAVLFIISKVRACRGRSAAETHERAGVGDGGPSRFEAIAAGGAGLAYFLFGSLSTPWVPPETILTESGERTAYMLRVERDTATVLLAEGRTLVRVPSDTLTGEYCETNSQWWTETPLQLFTSEKYPSCP